MKIKAIADFVVTFVDLLEAEGRALRRAILRVGWGLVFLIIAGLLVLAAAAFLLTGIYLYCASQFSPPIAALVVSCVAFLLALISAFVGYRRMR